MNVEIGNEAAQFPENEYINGIVFAVYVSGSGCFYLIGDNVHKKSSIFLGNSSDFYVLYSVLLQYIYCVKCKGVSVSVAKKCHLSGFAQWTEIHKNWFMSPLANKLSSRLCF